MKTALFPPIALTAFLAAFLILAIAPPSSLAEDSSRAVAAAGEAAPADAPTTAGEASPGAEPAPAGDAASADVSPAPPAGPDLPDVPGITTSGVSDQSVYEDLTKLTRSLADLSDDIAASSMALKPSLTSTAETLNSLLRTYQRPGARPLEQEDILRQLRGLRASLASELSTLNDKGNTLSQKQSELNILKATSRDSADSPKTGEGSMIQPLLKEAESRSEEVSVTLTAVSGPAKVLLDSLDSYISRYDAEIPVAWKAYYFTESRLTSFRLPEFTGEGGYFSEWYRQLTSKEMFIYPPTPHNWASSLTAFLLTAGLVAFLGLLIYKGANFLPAQPVDWKKALQEIVKGPWLFLNLGLALLNASRTPLGGNYLFFSIPGVLILIWALAAISWRLRLAAKPSLSSHRSPLNRFYPPAALGVLLLFADVPTGALSILWFVILGTFIFQLRKIKHSSGDSAELQGFLLERFAYGSAVYFAVISILIAIVGYPRLAILAFMLLFTVINILILGNAFSELGSILCDRVFPNDTAPVKYSILNAFLIPVTWTLSLLCTIPWLTAIPGSTSLLKNFMTTGYSVGEASFDLTKVLLILALFFMFRSLRNLGRTSLEHLPNELQLSKSVIVPVQTMLTYVVWIIFAVIAMGLLGVNWTSLAVAASGLGLGLGIGLQNIFTNVVSGVILIFGRSIQVGDLVEVGGITGTVKSVDFRCTLVETADNSLVYVPNSTIVSTQFINWTRNGRQARRTLVIRAFYDTDIQSALRLIEESTRGTSGVSFQNPPQAVLSDLNEKYLEFNLFVTVADISSAPGVLSALRVKIEQSFAVNGIKLYRQSLDVNLGDALRRLQAADTDNPEGPTVVS